LGKFVRVGDPGEADFLGIQAFSSGNALAEMRRVAPISAASSADLDGKNSPKRNHDLANINDGGVVFSSGNALAEMRRVAPISAASVGGPRRQKQPETQSRSCQHQRRGVVRLH